MRTIIIILSVLLFAGVVWAGDYDYTAQELMEKINRERKTQLSLLQQQNALLRAENARLRTRRPVYFVRTRVIYRNRRSMSNYWASRPCLARYNNSPRRYYNGRWLAGRVVVRRHVRGSSRYGGSHTTRYGRPHRNPATRSQRLRR